MKINVSRLKDAFPDAGIDGCPDASDQLVQWMKDALPVTLEDMPERISHPGMTPDMAEEIDVFLCSREEMSEFSDQEDLIGVFLVDTPEHDPFDDDAPLAKRLRVMVVIDKAEVEDRLRDEICKDGERWEQYLHEYEDSEATTSFHEVAHAMLYAANSDMISPAAAESAMEAGELDHDIFDLITGYGIRSLTVSGKEVDAENAEDARILMEEWCEEVGRRACQKATASLGVGFYEAFGIDVQAVARQALGEGIAPA